MKISKNKIFDTHRKQLKGLSILFLLGILYYLVIQFTPFRIPCLFHKLTGFACPGCGTTHFILALLHGNFRLAFQEHPAYFFLLPLWMLAIALRILKNPKWMQKGSLAEQIFLYGTIVILLLFGIVRNLPGMEFLLPVYEEEVQTLPQWLTSHFSVIAAIL